MLRLFTYPADYIPAANRKAAQVQIGNSVPVELGKAVARHLAGLLGYMESADDRPVQLAFQTAD